jgi:hypothetical protein
MVDSVIQALSLMHNTRKWRFKTLQWMPAGSIRLACGRIGVAVLLIAAAGFDAVAADAVRPVGRFADQKLRGEHCSGHTVDIWKAPDGLLGLLTYCDGLLDRRAAGLLKEIVFGEASGSFSFIVRLSVGTDYLGGGVERPSKDVWRFSGKLKADRIAGTLDKADEAYAQRAHGRVRLMLRKAKAAPKSYPDVAGWQHDIESVLSVHGPKEP